MIHMKKKLVAVIVALTMAMTLAMPAMAFAADSPSGTVKTYQTDAGVVSIDFSGVPEGIRADIMGTIMVELLPVSNVSDGLKAEAAKKGTTATYFNVYSTGQLPADFGTLKITFPGSGSTIHEVGASGSGVYEYSGNTTISVKSLSHFAVVAGAAGTGATSPATGVDSVAGLAIVGGIIVVAAAGMVLYSRRVRNN